MSGPTLAASMPFVWPLLAGVLLLFVSMRQKSGDRDLALGIAGCGLGLGFTQLSFAWQSPEVAQCFDGKIVLDRFAIYATALIYGVAAAVFIIDRESERVERRPGEFAFLLLTATVGLALAVTARHFLILMLGLEMAAGATTALMASDRQSSRGLEAALRFFLGQGLSLALMALGAALVFGSSGALDFESLAAVRKEGGADPLLLAGIGFLVTGLAVRITAVPFHLGSDEVSQGAPVSCAAWLATAFPLVGLIVLARFGTAFFQNDFEALRNLFWWLALATMSVGHLAALAQSGLRRMLASGTVGQVGWCLLAVAVMTGEPLPDGGRDFASSQAMVGLLFALGAMVFGNLGAFFVLARLESQSEPLQLEGLRGLGARHPHLAFMLGVSSASLAGVPGTVGFIGRFLILEAALEATIRTGDESFTLLAILGIVNSLIGLGSYLRIPIQAYLEAPIRDVNWGSVRRASVSWITAAIVISGSSLWFGFGPEIAGLGVDPAVDLVRRAVGSIR